MYRMTSGITFSPSKTYSVKQYRTHLKNLLSQINPYVIKHQSKNEIVRIKCGYAPKVDISDFNLSQQMYANGHQSIFRNHSQMNVSSNLINQSPETHLENQWHKSYFDSNLHSQKIRGYKDQLLGNWQNQIDEFKMLKEDDYFLIQQKLKGNNKLTVGQLNQFTNMDDNMEKFPDGQIDNTQLKKLIEKNEKKQLKYLNQIYYRNNLFEEIIVSKSNKRRQIKVPSVKFNFTNTFNIEQKQPSKFTFKSNFDNSQIKGYYESQFVKPLEAKASKRHQNQHSLPSHEIKILSNQSKQNMAINQRQDSQIKQSQSLPSLAKDLKSDYLSITNLYDKSLNCLSSLQEQLKQTRFEINILSDEQKLLKDQVFSKPDSSSRDKSNLIDKDSFLFNNSQKLFSDRQNKTFGNKLQNQFSQKKQSIQRQMILSKLKLRMKPFQ